MSKARNHENLVIEAPARSRPVAVASYAPPYPRYQELELPGAQGHLELRAGGLWRVCSVAPPPAVSYRDAWKPDACVQRAGP